VYAHVAGQKADNLQLKLKTNETKSCGAAGDLPASFIVCEDRLGVHFKALGQLTAAAQQALFENIGKRFSEKSVPQAQQCSNSDSPYPSRQS
jgi:hypothetical protein